MVRGAIRGPEIPCLKTRRLFSRESTWNLAPEVGAPSETCAGHGLHCLPCISVPRMRDLERNRLRNHFDGLLPYREVPESWPEVSRYRAILFPRHLVGLLCNGCVNLRQQVARNRLFDDSKNVEVKGVL